MVSEIESLRAGALLPPVNRVGSPRPLWRLGLMNLTTIYSRYSSAARYVRYAFELLVAVYVVWRLTT